MPWPTKASTTEKPCVLDVALHFGRPLRSTSDRLPISSMARSSVASVTSSSRWTSGSTLPTGVGHRRVAAPAVQLAAGVDADDVSFDAACRGPGIPWTTSSLTDMQVTAGNGTRAGHALEQRHRAPLLGEKLARPPRRSRPWSRPGRTIERGQLMGLPDQQAGLAHQGDFTRRPKDLHAFEYSRFSMARAAISSRLPVDARQFRTVGRSACHADPARPRTRSKISSTRPQPVDRSRAGRVLP